MSDDVVVLNSEVEKRYAPSAQAAPVGASSATGGGGVPVEVDPELEAELSRIPDKLAFKIGEVADIVGVKAYVLRYWETEFEVLKPKKSKHNQRMYERKDVENLLLIKKLLYRDRFSIEGARSALKKLKKDNVRVKQIKTIAEHMEEARDRLFDMLDEIAAFRQLVK
ncbi:MAG: MerR family transcriptional regulator [Bdellovibrionales bacterium]|nr:MerR family transcriptional regulator [Bdellovibrionales bacterium]